MYIIVSKLPSNTELFVKRWKRGQGKNPDRYAQMGHDHEIDPNPGRGTDCPDIRVEFRPDRHTILWTTHKYAHYYYFR